MLRKVDPESALRIQPRDLKRLVRALEVFFLTGRPLTAHFADTASPIPDVEVLAIGLRLPAEAISARVTRRVDEQFDARAARRDPRRCSRAGFRRPRGRSAAWSTGRRWSTCTACATRRRRAR